MSKKNLIQIIGIVTLINIASRVFGFLREIVIGYHFGTSFKADSIIIAYTIPTFLYIVLGGAITTAFISVYNKIHDKTEKKQFKEIIFTYSFTLSCLLTIIFLLFSNEVISLFFPGLHANEHRLVVDLFYWMTPSVLFLVVAMWFSGLLNVNGKFFHSSLAVLVNNLLFVLIAVVLFPFMGVYAYSLGAVIGAVFMFIMQVIYVQRENYFTYTFRFKTENTSYVSRFIRVFFPILLGGATLQFYFLVHRMFASQLNDGFVSALNYSSKLVQFPQAILMTAITTVIYPLLAKKMAANKRDEISAIYSKGMGQLFVFIVPISIYIYFYANDIIFIVFEHGSFTSKSTEITANLLKIFVIGMFAHAANLFVTRFYYAMERAYLPVITGILAVFGLNILIISSFIGDYGAAAIAWGTTISSFFQLFVLIIFGIMKLDLKIGSTKTIMKFIVYSIILLGITYCWSRFIKIPFVLLDVPVSLLVLMVISILLGRVMKLIEIPKLRRKHK